MALLGNYITVRLQQNSSGVTSKVVAESTSVDMQCNAEALEATAQADALVSKFEGGKNTIQVSGDYLLASDGEQFENLFAHKNAGEKIEVDIYRSDTLVMSTEGVFTSLNTTGGLSDALATGAYAMGLDAVALEEGYGPELHISANAASDPNGNEADATTDWAQTGLDAGSNVFESQSSVKSTGSYALHGHSNDTPTAGSKFEISISVDAGDTYLATFNGRHVGSGGDWGLLVDSNLTVLLTSSDTSFAAYEQEFVASASTIKIQAKEVNASNDGGAYLDNVSLKKKL